MVGQCLCWGFFWIVAILTAITVATPYISIHHTPLKRRSSGVTMDYPDVDEGVLPVKASCIMKSTRISSDRIVLDVVNSVSLS